jgi:hypothetical protein
MTTEQEPGGQEDFVLPVIFLGREIYARMPTAEQLLVWRRTVNRLTDAPIDASWNGSEVLTALERLLKIINSLMANKADIEWLDDQFLLGAIDFQKLAPFVTLVADKFAEAAEAEGNRETRRAATKKATAKKAIRKKATTS